jgi:signal peptidase I
MNNSNTVVGSLVCLVFFLCGLLLGGLYQWHWEDSVLRYDPWRSVLRSEQCRDAGNTSIIVFSDGSSMLPSLKHGDSLFVAPVRSGVSLVPGDIVLFNTSGGVPVAHRIISAYPSIDQYQTKGDNNLYADPGFRRRQDFYGVVCGVGY